MLPSLDDQSATAYFRIPSWVAAELNMQLDIAPTIDVIASQLSR